MDLESITVDELLLILKIGFLVLLYLFIWRIVRSASRDIRTQQESFVLTPGAAPVHPRTPGGRLVVVKSDAVPVGSDFTVDSTSLTVGRGPQNDVELDGDQFASARHARFEPRADGLWVQDVGSTNGTFVNGAAVSGEARLGDLDELRIGDTEFRFELEVPEG
jgi:hypothetical protein